MGHGIHRVFLELLSRLTCSLLFSVRCSMSVLTCNRKVWEYNETIHTIRFEKSKKRNESKKYGTTICVFLKHILPHDIMDKFYYYL